MMALCSRAAKAEARTARGKFGKDQQQQKFTGMCNICGKTGHKKEDCWFKEKYTYKGKDTKGKFAKPLQAVRDATGRGKGKTKNDLLDRMYDFAANNPHTPSPSSLPRPRRSPSASCPPMPRPRRSL